MKFRVTFKTPDAVDEALDEAARQRFEQIKGLVPHREDDIEEMVLECKANIRDKVSKWVKYGEYVTIEFDTEAGTATVVPV